MKGILYNKLFFFTLLFFYAGNIFSQPVAEFSATPVTGCAPLLVNFKDLSTGTPTGWQWDLGNGTASNQNPSTTYFDPGKYKITLTATNASGSGTVTKDQYITVLPNPVVNFTVTDTTGCLPFAAQFTDQSTAGNGSVSTWKWDFGDGSGSTIQHPPHTYTSAGTFDVTLQVKNTFGCSGAGFKAKFINTGNSVKADFRNNLQGNCSPPVTLTFKNLSTGPDSIRYQWNFGDNTTSALANPQHTYATAGNFTVRLNASGGSGQCSDLVQKIIVIGSVKADFNLPSEACLRIPFSLTNTSSPVPVSVLWNYGDGTTADSLNPSKTYNAAGNYLIKMVADFGACRDSVSKPITVPPRQNINFTAKDTIACKAPFIANFTSNLPGAVTYSWNFGDGGTSNTANPVHTYTAAGNFDVSLSVTNSSGCVDTIKKVKYIKIQVPVISLPYLPLKNCVPFSYTFTANIISFDSIVRYNWDFGDGFKDSVKMPTHTFTLVGSYTITLSVITASGCTATIKVLSGVIVGNKPVADFTANPLSVCANKPVSFTDLSTGNVNEWRWDFGDKNFSTAKNPGHVYTDTGFYKVSLLVRSSGCPDSITKVNYIYIKPAVSRFFIRSICATPMEKNFIDSSKGADTWKWDFGDGRPGTNVASPPPYVYADTGTYVATLIVTNNTTGCADTSSKIVQVIREKATFNANNTSICKGAIIFFKSQNNATKILNYNWTFGDGTLPVNIRDSVSHPYFLSGIFSPRLIITDRLGCNDTITQASYINVSGPTAKFSNPQNSCINSIVNFVDTSITDGTHPILQWKWDYGDSTSEIYNAPPFMHTYIRAGTYTIKEKITDSNGCTDSVIKKNALFIAKPVADFTSADTVTCPLGLVQFTGLSKGINLTYQWNFGDGITASGADAVHQYAAPGKFAVSLKVIDQFGCADSIQKANYITVTFPVANFTLNDSTSTCPPFSVSFTNTSVNYVTLLWDFGDGNVSSSLNPSHFYSVPGTYNVKLKVTGPGGCSDEKFNTIVVKGPKGVLTYTNTVGCNLLQTNFRASATDNILFTWDFNDGVTIITGDSTIQHIYNQPGFYLPKLILEDSNGCKVPITGIDTIKVITIQANFNALSDVICDAGNVSFIDSSISNDIVNNWRWHFGDGDTAAQQNPVHYYASPGLYSISLTATTANGCTDTATKNDYINVISRPNIGIQSNTSGCVFDTFTFKGLLLQPDTMAINWQWNFGNGNTSAIQNPPPQVFAASGSYSITAIATNISGCRDTATRIIVINPLPEISGGRDTFLCLGSVAQLQASGANAYQWVQPVNYLSCTSCANPITNTPDDITYVVKGTNSAGCIAFDSVKVKVKKPFILTITPTIDSICIGQSVQLNASAAENYLWTPATGLSSTVIRNPTASPAIGSVYKLVAYDSVNCFKDSAFVNISVFKNPTVNAGPDKTIKAGASALISPVYSDDVTNWLWSPAVGLDCNNCAAPVARPTITTTYTITVKNNGSCSAIDNVTVFTTCKSENIFIPNTFSPNGDGVNDVFYPRGTGLNRIRGMKIFNRWGETVFEKSNFYANDPSSGWDGSVRGKKVTADVYTFVIDIICDNNDVIVQQGSITLIK